MRTQRGLAAGAAALVAGTAVAALLGRTRKRRLARISFRGATVLITGGARGLGLVLARMLAAEGAHVWIVSRSHDELQRAAHDAGLHGDVRWAVCDVRDPAAVARCISEIVYETGRLDMLVNNAGIIQVGPIEHSNPRDFTESLDTHFWGPFHVTRAALPWMRGQGLGRIVNITSIGGRVAVPHLLAYSVGKFALVGFSQGLGAELRKDGVIVTTVVPGLMRTGSHVRARLRGRHRREAQWFGLGVATSLTSVQVERAARQIIEASRRGRSHLTIGWQARLVEMAQGVMPETTASLLEGVNRRVLPSPSASSQADHTRTFDEVDTGWVRRLLPTDAARRNNELRA